MQTLSYKVLMYNLTYFLQMFLLESFKGTLRCKDPLVLEIVDFLVSIAAVLKRLVSTLSGSSWVFFLADSPTSMQKLSRLFLYFWMNLLRELFLCKSKLTEPSLDLGEPQNCAYNNILDSLILVAFTILFTPYILIKRLSWGLESLPFLKRLK